MNYYEEDPLAEVHRIRAELLEEHGGIKGYLKHIRKEQPRLEKEGWQFITSEELIANRTREKNAVLCN